jgi:hypothetical protein
MLDDLKNIVVVGNDSKDDELNAEENDEFAFQVGVFFSCHAHFLDQFLGDHNSVFC